MIPGPPNQRELGFYFALAQVGLEMVVPVGIGLALDYYLDWAPWSVVVGAVLGLVCGIVHLIALVDRHQKDQDNKRNAGPDP